MKNKVYLSIILLFITQVFVLQAANQLTLVVKAGELDRQNTIVSVDISGQGFQKSQLKLFELSGKKKKQIPCQVLENDKGKQLVYWILDGKTKAGVSRMFLLEKNNKKQTEIYSMKVEDTGKALLLIKGDQKILQYNYAFTPPPEGVDNVYGRSGYIHPAYSPAGNVLTTIQPKDHYHHYGIWNPWTRMQYEDQVYDLWNLGDKQGTVRAEQIQNVYQGAVFNGWDALLGHYIFTPAGEKNIMQEEWKIKAWNTGSNFIWDFESHLHPSTSQPIVLKAYRYAGLGYRATEDWTRDNSTMLTSEAHSRQQIDGTTARWVYAEGETPTGRSGLLFLGHLDNQNAPQPLRIWDENANKKRGDVFINFAPTKNVDWELKPGQESILRYRIVAFENGITPQQADAFWNDFVYPPVVEIIK